MISGTSRPLLSFWPGRGISRALGHREEKARPVAESDVKGRGWLLAFPSPEPLRLERFAGLWLGGGPGSAGFEGLRAPRCPARFPLTFHTLCHFLELSLSMPPFPFLETVILPTLHISLENSWYIVQVKCWEQFGRVAGC